MKREDIEYLESVIIGKIQFNQIGDFAKTLRICNELNSMGFAITYNADADLCGTYWADKEDYEIFVQECSLYLETEDARLLQYIEDNGSGKFRDRIKEPNERSRSYEFSVNPDSFEIIIRTPNYEIENLPEGFSYDISEDEDNRINVRGRDESTGMDLWGCLNKSYYYQP